MENKKKKWNKANSEAEETVKPVKKKSRKGLAGIIIAALCLVIAVAGLAVADGRHVRFYFRGENEIQQEYGEEFKEPEVWAVSVGRIFGEGKRHLPMETVGQVDTGNLGKYTIEHKVRYFWQEASAKRIVNVVDTKGPEITLNYNEDYQPDWFTGYEEEGYTAVDNFDGDVTDKVERVDYPDRLEYTVTDSHGNSTTVVRESNFSDTAPKIELLGDAEGEMKATHYYNDPGVKVYDSKGNDLSEYVKTEGEVKPHTPGEYQIRYYLENAQGEVVEAFRKVTVTPNDKFVEIDPDEKTIYLTFDDGPGPYTDQLLDILKKYDVKATFFVTCLNQKYSDCIGRAYSEGHSIGAHTATHNYKKVYASEEAYFADLDQVQQLIFDQTGEYTDLVRFPGGSSNTVSRFNPGIMTRLAQELTDKGYQYFDWNVSSGDAGETTVTSEVVDNVISGCAGRKASVVLQHDVKDFSVNGVERIIRWGLDNGYTFRALNVGSPTAHHGIAN